LVPSALGVFGGGRLVHALMGLHMPGAGQLSIACLQHFYAPVAMTITDACCIAGYQFISRDEQTDAD